MTGADAPRAGAAPTRGRNIAPARAAVLERRVGIAVAPVSSETPNHPIWESWAGRTGFGR